jgi:hypothetical protein
VCNLSLQNSFALVEEEFMDDIELVYSGEAE